MATTTSLVTNSGGNIYTSSGNTVVTWLSLTNYTSNTCLANVHVVPSGGSANVQNQIISNAELTGGETMQIYVGNEKLILENSTAIYAIANLNTTITSCTSYTTA